MTAEKTLVRAKELLRPPLSEKRCELIKGVVVEMSPPGERHAELALALGSFLRAYALAHGGRALGQVGIWIERDPDTVREPDAAFITSERTRPSARGFARQVPDVVVEVVSPNDRNAAVISKVAMWLEAGARLVWVAYPETSTIWVYRPVGEPQVLTIEDVLEGGDVLPGFSVPVREIFA